jgi:hypothetical protein
MAGWNSGAIKNGKGEVIEKSIEVVEDLQGYYLARKYKFIENHNVIILSNGHKITLKDIANTFLYETFTNLLSAYSYAVAVCESFAGADNTP